MPGYRIPRENDFAKLGFLCREEFKVRLLYSYARSKWAAVYVSKSSVGLKRVQNNHAYLVT